MKLTTKLTTIIITLFLLGTPAFAATHVITVDQNAVSDSTETVSTIQQALELAEELNPSEELPVLIKLGQGEFHAPETEWKISSKWIFFAGNGPENTRIVADKIEINPEAITSFKNIYIDSVLDIGDNFLPVGNTKILQLEKKEGQLEGVWQNAVGEIQSPFSKESKEDLNVTEISDFDKLVTGIPAENSSEEENNKITATGSYVLKSGDTMTGPLQINATLNENENVTEKYTFPSREITKATAEIIVNQNIAGRKPTGRAVFSLDLGKHEHYTGTGDSIANQINNNLGEGGSQFVRAIWNPTNLKLAYGTLTLNATAFGSQGNGIRYSCNSDEKIFPSNFGYSDNMSGSLSGGTSSTSMVRQLQWSEDGLTLDTPVTINNELSAGNLTVPNINLYSSSNIYGYLVSGSRYPDANGIYFDNGNLHNSMPLYENEKGFLIWKYSYGNYWIIGPTFNSFNHYCSVPNPAIPLGSWYGCTVSVHEQPVPPKINFANGKAINLQDGVDSQDAATVGQIESKISETRTYVDNKVFSSVNISDEAITSAKLADDVDNKYVNADDIKGDTMSGPLTVKKLIIDKSFQPAFSLRRNGIVKGTIFYWKAGDDSIHIGRYDEKGIYVDSPIKIKRQTGEVNIKHPLTVPELKSSAPWNIGGQPISVPIYNKCAGSGTANSQVTHGLNDTDSNDVVIITPTTQPSGLYYVEKSENSFTVKCANDFNFDYLILKR